MRSLLVLLSGAVLLSAGLCWGGTIYVKPDGTGDAPTIAAAMDSAAVGDTLLLASGTFTGEGNRDVEIPDKNLVIRSETGNADDCVIDFEENLGFRFEGGSAVIKGVTMTSASCAILVCPGWAVLRVRDCVFSDCLGPGGGLGICSAGEVRITGCKFLSNVGGAVNVECGQGFLQVWIDGCTFCGNTDAYFGAAINCTMHEMQVFITKSVFCHNSAGIAGGAIAWDAGSYPEVRRCTFFANSAPAGSAISGVDYAGCANCIIAYGTGGCPIDVVNPLGIAGASCTNIYGNEGGDWVGVIADDLGQNGNFSACPGFCYWEIEPYDLHLCSTSPCLPGNHPDGADCGLIGALGEDCACGPSATVPSTWGAIKAMYR
jgi:hypothetical protein